VGQIWKPIDIHIATRDQTGDLDLAIGKIRVASSIAAVERGTDAGDLVNRLDDLGGFEIAGKSISLDIDIGRDVMRDLTGVAAEAYVAIERRGAEPHRPAFLPLLEDPPEPDVLAAIRAATVELLERQIFPSPVIEKAAHRCVAIWPIQHDAADNLKA
jgi:hypothetical protein